MPIHEYRCGYCGKEFEKVTVKIDDVSESLPCPECKEGIGVKLISSGSFIVHGYNVTNGYSSGNR